MAKTLSVNENNDLYLGIDGNISVSIGLRAVLEDCEHVIKTRLDEVALNTDQGIPYFQTVWNGIPNLIQFQAAVRVAILQIADVVEVVSLNTKIVDDAVEYRAVIRTTYGEGTING